ncbi:adenylate/guanylate cyclase domain-containing protein [Novosphingobium sp. B 225]|uniref:adenylate/guanylate cyclase domain-containing protein n=1 Tax=Novosphingobium sp. B 225 TaxID=1961849 RepID=UPI000B4A9731|nr:adenylate/guanylate cyclase domain-containing protein [Novosphingobium sp. B 225]
MADRQSEQKRARANVLARGWRNMRAAGLRQLVLTVTMLMLALGLARYSWHIPVLNQAEAALYDFRAYLTAQKVDQDQRLQLVVYDDQTLIAARKRSPLDRGLLAKALANIDAMGAKAIGIDMLFDQPQDEDETLIATLRAMQTPTFVGYTSVEGTHENIVFDQQSNLDAFMARLRGSDARPASIRIDNANGVTRNWPSKAPGLPSELSRAMVAAGGGGEAAAFADYHGAIRYRLPAEADRPVFSSLKIDLFADPAVASALADQVRGRYVLIGGDIVDTDRVTTTLTGSTGEVPPGIQVHAAMIAQMLDGKVLRGLPDWALVGLALLVVLTAGLTSLLEVSPLRLAPFLLVQLALFGGLPFLLEYKGISSEWIPAVGWPLGWIVAFAAVGSAARASGSVQRKFAQSALGKYLPRDIAQQIIENPELLSLHGEQQRIYILFSDLEGFTEMSSQIAPDMVASLLNDYLDSLSKVILDHGGVIDKYVGDAIVAFWGAPIAREDDGTKAALAGHALFLAGEDFRRRRASPELPPIGKTRVGLHYGEAVVGNFGGEGRFQYTALGDAMNTASRLESANKLLDSGVMASREFAERSGLEQFWRQMGRVRLRGRAQPVDLYEPMPDFPAEDRAELDRAAAVTDSDPDEALRLASDAAGRHPEDKALQNLVLRLSKLTKEGYYVLG